MRCYSLRGSGRVKLRVNHFFSSFELLIQQLFHPRRRGLPPSATRRCHCLSSNIAKCAQSGTVLETGAEEKPPPDSRPRLRGNQALEEPRGLPVLKVQISRFAGDRHAVNPPWTLSSRFLRNREPSEMTPTDWAFKRRSLFSFLSFYFFLPFSISR